MCPERYDELNADKMSKAQSQSHTSTKGCRINLIFESDTHEDTIRLHDLVEEGKCYMGKFLLQASFREYVRFVEGTYNQRLSDPQEAQLQGTAVDSFEILGVLTYPLLSICLCVVPLSCRTC